MSLNEFVAEFFGLFSQVSHPPFVCLQFVNEDIQRHKLLLVLEQVINDACNLVGGCGGRFRCCEVSAFTAVEAPNPGIGLAGCQCGHSKEDGGSVYDMASASAQVFAAANLAAAT